MSRGYTVVEAIVVLASLAILTAVALPLVRSARVRAEAREVVEAVRTVASAAAEAQAQGIDTAARGAAVGDVPVALVAFLPSGFEFDGTAFRLGWNRWTFGATLAPLVEGRGIGTIVVEIPDPALGDAFLKLAHPSLWLRVGTSFAFLVPDA